ncbi:hypothetical protein AMJ49_03580 [Parcubacteria bacterium DG_74_2]|nr:MAG: hypothetical protein AMJ49_03580 [Parcubacteria bacterium DG_74_2]
MEEMKKFYQEFTPKTIRKWEKGAKENPDAEWSCNKINEILPFIKKVMPRIGRNQSLFGLSIISLLGKPKNEGEIIRYGLEPLLKAGVLTEEEMNKIIEWFQKTKPTWNSGGAGDFTKEFEIEGKKYRLITDSYRNYRDLNLQVVH